MILVLDNKEISAAIREYLQKRGHVFSGQGVIHNDSPEVSRRLNLDNPDVSIEIVLEPKVANEPCS